MKVLQVLFRVLIFGIVALGLSMCTEVDDIPPVITLNGPDSVTHILNRPYVDQGAKALDDTEGDISSKLFVKVEVNVNKVGNYKVTYRVVDDAGNEATPVYRYVNVVNTSQEFTGQYAVVDTEVFPGQFDCSFQSLIVIDSTLNDRIIFKGFACDTLLPCFADIYDSLIVVPFQAWTSEDIFFSIQGSGWVNDSVIAVGYTLQTNNETMFRDATFTR